MSTPSPAAPDDRLLARIGLPNVLSRIAAGGMALLLLSAAVDIEAAAELLIATKSAAVLYFDGLFVGVATLGVLVVGLFAAHPRASMRLGPDDSRPEFTRHAWFAMLFSAGLASGLLYWGMAEPILHFQTNPFLEGAEGGSEAAVRSAMRLTVLHWGLHGWAMYVIAGLAIAIYAYRHDKPLSFRTALAPLLGSHLDRWPGRAIDLLALFGTVAGVATSIGISAAGMNATLSSIFQLEVSIPNQVVIVFMACMLGVVSALSGVSRGIRLLSELNIWVSTGLLGAILLLGPTAFIVALFAETVFDYALHFLPTGVWVANTAEGQAWQADWTVFYWAWWLAWTPFVSLFIARISRGRTVREFAVAVTLVPTLVTVVWMSVLGGAALHQELMNPGAVSQAVNQDYSLGMVAVIEHLGSAATLLTVVASFLLFTWLITSLDSATLVLCHLLEVEEAPAAKIFWGLALAALTSLLLLFGGLPALQAASIVIGLPLAGVVLALIAGLVWDLLRGRI